MEPGKLCHSEHAQSAGEEPAVALLRSHFLLARNFRGRNPPLAFRRSCRHRPGIASVPRTRIPALAAFRENHSNVRNTPLVAVRASLRRRTNALHARPVIGDGILHIQVIDLNVEIFLGAQKVRIVERRLQQLPHMRRHPLLGEQQSVARFFHALALDQVKHQPRLLRRHAQVTHFSSKFHSRNLALGSWPLAPSQKPRAKSQQRFYAFGAAGAAGVIAPGPPGMPAGLAATSVAARMEWPLNVRVKLNSPSLWPTMFSVTYTGINFLPLCTAIVCPTISGITVERRDQVRSTFFSLRAFMPSTLDCR